MNVMSLRLEEREIKLIEEMARKEGKINLTIKQAVDRLWINLLNR